MAQTVQIIPKFSFPYVETHINDYTHVSDEQSYASSAYDDTVRFVNVFTGPKGKDNTWIKKTTEAAFKSTFGESNYKKYGQPLMMPIALLANGNCECWCMRVMPENAAYAHVITSLYYKADADTVDVTERKFRLKVVNKYSETPITTADDVLQLLATPDAGLTEGKDAEGYTWAPFMAMYSNGRGKYGNNYRARIVQNTTYEKEYGIKVNSYEILSTESGLQKVASYIGCSVTSSKFKNATYINDILGESETGIAPIIIYSDEDSLESVHAAYLEFCSKLAEDAAEAMASETNEGKLQKLNEIYYNASNPVKLDEFDFLYGRNVFSATTSIPFVSFPQSISADEYAEIQAANESAEESDKINLADYTTTVTSSFDIVSGISLKGGSDGYFDSPRKITYTDPASGEEKEEQWTYEDELEFAYNQAFSGELDAKILTPRRIQATALFDANYPMSVKTTMADLTLLRDDAMLYIDTGLISSFSKSELQKMIDDYAGFDNRLISKNTQYFQTIEPNTNKRVNVTITYFLAQKYAEHVKMYGPHIPLVKAQAQLSGHIKDSLRPTVEDYETELKETLYTNRFNYFETVDDNVFQRATQTTSQSDTSDLSEESNVTTLYTLKRGIERDISDSLYDFSDLEIRSSFRDYEKSKYADWIGSKLEDFDIVFEMNEFEAEHAILHAYLNITFRGIYKRAIAEIDINKRDIKTMTSETTTDTSSNPELLNND